MILPGSYANGFAPRDGEPLFPELWRGCVGAWSPCLGPTGLTLRDWSGAGSHGSLTSATAADSWIASQGKMAAYFATSYFDVINDLAKFSLIQNTLRFSISYWQNIASLTTRTGAIGSAASTGEKGFFVINEYGAGNGTNCPYIAVQFGTGGASSIAVRTDDNTLKLGWQHILITCDGSSGTVKFYVAGSQRTTQTVGIQYETLATGSSTRNLNIGRINHSANFLPYTGLLDDVRIYDYAVATKFAALLASRRGIAYELAPVRYAGESLAAFTRRLQAAQMIGGGLM